MDLPSIHHRGARQVMAAVMKKDALLTRAALLWAEVNAPDSYPSSGEYRGTSLTRKLTPLGPYRRAMPGPFGRLRMKKDALLKRAALLWAEVRTPPPQLLQGYLAHKRYPPRRNLQ